MVFKSERNLESPVEIDYNNLGPGEYINLFVKNYSLNKEPFLTSSPRSKFEIKDTPGPGAYYHDENKINYLKNIQSEKVSKQNDRTNLLTKGLDGKLSKLFFLVNSEKKGFNIKSKRFKIIDSSGYPPGPGKYFKDKKNVMKKKLKKLKENEMYSNKKFNIIKTKKKKKIPTIPSKENNFGFEVLNNGELIQKQNPELYRTFSGEKGDTVGPGTYEIEKPNNWLKTGTSWSKLRSIRDCNKTDFSNSISNTTNYSESKKNNINNIKSRASEKSKEFNSTKSFDLNDKSNINLNNNNSTNKNKKTLLNLIVTNCKINNNKKSNIPKTFETVIKKITPGPGYYYNESDTAFKVKFVPELKQFFGSKLSRFETKKNLSNSLGPGEYFKEEKEPIKMNKTSSFGFSPFSSSVDRFTYSEEKKDIPGPGDYEPSDLVKIKKISSNGKFGSNEIRFNNMYNLNWKNFIPGPGFYESNKDKNLNMSKTNKNFNKKGRLFNNTKNDLERYDSVKMNNLINQNYKEEEVPPLGSYNPEIVNSIDYKVKKKAYESKNNKVAFNSTYNRKKKKNNIIINCEESNLGPGYYYHENKKKDIKLSAVFHLPEFRRNINIKTNVSSTSPIVGPGKYNINSYNDWTKKSFNINFV